MKKNKGIRSEYMKTFEGVRRDIEKGMCIGVRRLGELALNKEEGLDGILVTIGLCIIALLLCVVMRDSLTEFIRTIVQEMTNSAKNILSTAGAFIPDYLRIC